jgi:SAM-dependent methyltransferase
MNLYDEEYYQHQKAGSYSSAQVVVPLVIDMVSPKSVIDIGCGVGNWLKVFKESGVENIRGLDGDYVDRSQLKISEQQFMPTDLSKTFPELGRWDLAMSLEVAEHLPSDSAKNFVDGLTKLAAVVLFSAAVPFQGGTGHINEQWPEYWIKLFAANGYIVVDPLRRQIWDNEKVEWWYAQNILFFVDQKELDNYPKLAQAAALTFPHQMALRHPKSFNFSAVRMALPKMIKNILQSRFKQKPGHHD